MMQFPNNSGLAHKQHVMFKPPSRMPQRIAEYAILMGMIGIVAAILFPVFANVPQHDNHGSCVGNEKQIGMALLQYAQDYDETFPCGARHNRQGNMLVKDTPRQAKYHAGQAWAGGLYPYAKNTQAFVCPDALRSMRHNSPPRRRTIGYGTEEVTLFPVSYAYNRNIALNANTSGLAASASTVMLTEVDGGFVNVQDADEHNTENIYSPAGNGLSLLAATDGTTPSEAAGGSRYATGRMGGYGRVPGCAYWPFYAPQSPPYHSYGAPPHAEGSMYLMADGHAKFFKPEQVSPGDDALSSREAQDCTRRHAAGTAHLEGFAVTFSVH